MIRTTSEPTRKAWSGAPERLPRRPSACGAALLLLLVGAPLAAGAAPPCDVTLRHDVRSGLANVLSRGEWRPAAPGTVRGDGPICVEVVGASTALYRIEIAGTPYDTASFAALSGFASRLPHGADLLRAATDAVALLRGHRPAAGGKARGESAAEDLRRALQGAIDEASAAVEGPGGLTDLRNAVMLTAGRMAIAPEETEGLAAALRTRLGDWLECVPQARGACEERLRMAATLTAAFVRLDGAATKLQALPDLDDESLDLLSRARAVLRGYPGLMAAARTVEKQAREVVRATSVVRWGPTEPEWGKGLALSVSVAPQEDPELGALATMDRRAAAYRYELRDSIVLGPGVALLVAPGARYPTWTNRGGIVAREGRTDQRINWALSLGLTVPALDGRGRGLPTLWLPQLLIAPAADQGMAFGVGAALSWKVFRLGAGGAWIRREKLSGTQEGATLQAGSKVATSKSYDLVPKLYLDVGLLLH